MTRKEFDKLVCAALRALPKRFKDKLQNVDVCIEEGRPNGRTLGLYEGVPLGERGSMYGVGIVLPDKITLFKSPLENESRKKKTTLKAVIRDTIRHEIAHHFGMTDEKLEKDDIY